MVSPGPDSFTLPLTAVQPSQLYLNGQKLSLVTRWFDFDAPNYDPHPVRKFDGTNTVSSPRYRNRGTLDWILNATVSGARARR
ncbi:hypothetical protein V5735_02430 (plasmid) [Haladaptatus sp. SPP-AMP-3]|uniref:hypothetical protein n=1 Tax=Haladaptatus sp. SPP-AMP-3 TaxID=3121295 RepID=UPI003C2C5E39